MKQRPRIVVLGSLVFDFVARAPRLPRLGETLLGDFFGMFPGGKGANQAVQAGRLGAEVFMIGRVGQDFLGEQLLTSLRASGVTTEFVREDTAVKTAACCIHVDAQGQNAIVIVPEANLACGREDVDAAAKVIRSADVLVCQLEIPVATVAYAVALAAEQRRTVILNPAPAQPLPESILACVTVLTPIDTEAEVLTGCPVKQPGHGEPDFCASLSKAAAQLLGSGVENVIITLGEQGAYLRTKEREQHYPAFPITPVDTTAAGDAFNGALAVALGEGKSMDEAIRFANAAGALSTTRAGAQPSMARRDALEAFRKTLAPS